MAETNSIEPASEGAHRNLLAGNIGSYGRYRDGAFAHLREIGVQYVEIPVPLPEQIGAVRAQLDRYGLGTLTLLTPCDVSSEEGTAAFATLLPAFTALGTRIAFVSVKHGDTPLPLCYERLRRIGDAAARVGVTLAVETHPPFAHNADAALATINGVDHPHVRLNYDTGNVYFYNQDFQGLSDLERIKDYVVAVHLKDTDGGFHSWHFPALGEGVVDFPEVFRILNGRGFYGPFTMELEGIQGENLSEAETWQRVTHSVHHLRQHGLVP
ncbi:MAG: sugar phosphate isomerase/epimerase [Armatimonadetes bacterium]|nr:sugar phosphate isomerase/epimerase [Armatimonadota bacterium]